jgi:hypothetical protein
MNTLKLIAPDGTDIAQCEIHTGSHKAARRVPARFARTVQFASTGSRLAVLTSKGWEPRRVVLKGGNWYTRTV